MQLKGALFYFSMHTELGRSFKNVLITGGNGRPGKGQKGQLLQQIYGNLLVHQDCKMCDRNQSQNVSCSYCGHN